MRLLVPFLVLAASAFASAQDAPSWIELGTSPFDSYRSEDVFFVDTNSGWAVNGDGELWRTQDGGANWDLADTAPGYFRATGFATTQKGWVGVLFSSAVLYETQDGGSTLVDVTDRIQPAVSGGICGIWAVDEQTAYAVGQYSGPAYLIKTTNGGTSWSSVSLSAYLDTAVDVYFMDETHGFIVGGIGGLGGSGFARILATADGGATWTIAHTSTAVGGWGWKLSFPTPEVGYASVEFNGNPADAVIMKTTDGGQTWSDMSVPGGGNLQGIGFLTPDIGWTSGRGVTSVTTDGGSTWQQIGLDGDINRFRFVDNIGYAAGHKIYRLDGTGVSNEPLPGTVIASFESLSPNPAAGALTIRYQVARTAPVELVIADVLGRTVARFTEGFKTPGSHTVQWSPDGQASGVYLVQLRTGSSVLTRTVTVLGQ